jgi:outer membrane protein
MKKIVFVLAVLILFAAPASSYAIGLEVGVGGWEQEPTGDASYQGGDSIDVMDDADLGKETQYFGRVKVDMPLVIPNIYLMHTPMSFSGEGKIGSGFDFGDTHYDAKFDTTLDLDHTDLALYYELPFVETATLGVLNVDLGLNVRYVDMNIEVKGSAAGVTKKESQSAQVYIPMVYAGVQLMPTDSVAIEAEYRGISVTNDSYTDLIARVKVKPFGPLFIAAGYRQQSVDIDEKDVELDMDFKGPFLEAGLQF